MTCPFKNLTIPQIKGPWRSICLIIAMTPIGGVATASLNGEIHNWSDIGTALRHGFLISVGLACGWIFFRSPWAPELQALLHQEQTTTTTKPSGVVVEQHTETTVSVPAPAPEKP